MARATTVLALLIAILLGGIAAALFATSSHSSLVFDPQPAAIGTATPVNVRITNQHGVRNITARIEQGGSSTIVDQVTRPATRFAFWRTRGAQETFHFTAGKDRSPQLKEGKARLIVEAQSNDLRAMTDVVATDVDVILRPPSVTTDGFQHYINQGGSELAVFSPSGSWQESGVRVGPATFRSFPAPGDNQQRLSLFAFSWDAPPDTPQWFLPATVRERKRRRVSGSRFSPRSFGPATCRSMTPSSKRSLIRLIPAVLEICLPDS